MYQHLLQKFIQTIPPKYSIQIKQIQKTQNKNIKKHNFNTKNKEIDQKFSFYLTRSNDDVVDWNKNKLNEKPNKSHHNKTNRGTNSNLGKFYK